MKLFDGKKIKQKILQELKKQIKAEKLEPVLAILLVGDEESSKLYIKLKKEAAVKVGIAVRDFYFSSQAKKEEIVARIQQLNADETVSGIIVQLPLPAVLNADRIIEAIDPKKDVDGFHKENRRLLEKGEKPHFLPVLPLAALTALSDVVKNNQVSLKGKTVLAMVNSDILGATMKIILAQEGIESKYLVRSTCLLFGSEKELQTADVLIMVCGCPNLIKGEMIKDGVILIDAGITRYHDGKVVGDIDQKSVAGKAAFLTPVPGGLGPLTVGLLLRNVYLAAQKSKIKI